MFFSVKRISALLHGTVWLVLGSTLLTLQPVVAQQRSTEWLLGRSWEIRGDDPDSAFYYARIAAEQARTERDSVNLAIGFRRIGMFVQDRSDTEGALQYYRAAQEIDSLLGNEGGIVSTEQKIGYLYTQLGRDREALVVLQSALDRSEHLGDEERIARCCNLLAPVCTDLGMFDRAFELLFRGLDIRKRSGDREGMAASTMNLASLYLVMGRLDEARSTTASYIAMQREEGSKRELAAGYLNMAQVLSSMRQFENSLLYADSAGHLFGELLDRQGSVNAMCMRADALVGLDRLDAAARIYEQALDSMGTYGDSEKHAEVQLALAGIDDRKGRQEKAHKRYQEVLRWCNANGDIFSELSALEGLAANERQQGRLDEALQHLEEATALRDSLYNEHTGNAFATAEMREKYDAGQREKEIKDLKVEIDLKEEKERRRTLERNMVILATLALLIVLLLLWRNLRHRKRHMQQQQELHVQEVNELMSTQEVKSLETMLTVQRNERNRIAQDLHDRLGSMLSVIKMNISKDDGDEVSRPAPRTDAGHLTRMLDDAVAEVRRLSHDMAHSTLADGGLDKTLVEFHQALVLSGKLEVELGLHGLEKRLDQRLEIAIYRIVQELVGNVLKHAKAAHLSIEVVRTPTLVSIIVADDGLGFDTASPSAGLGLSGVRKRVSEIGGEVHWDSKPGQGTTASVEIALASN